MKTIRFVICTILFGASVLARSGAAMETRMPAATPPLQAASGPGGKTYAHAKVEKKRFGTGGAEYWIFEPAAPRLDKAPLVVFMHGWSATNPQAYGAWIEHIVRRGNIVVFPRYQSDMQTPPAEFTPNSIGAIENAIRRLQTQPGHTRPDLTRFALAGHSMGAMICANIAALAATNKLPAARAIFCAQPGRTWGLPAFATIPVEDRSAIPAGSLLVILVGDKDEVVRDIDAKRIYNESTNVPRANKNYVVLQSDTHGTALVADHYAPCAVDTRYDGEAQNSENTADPTSRFAANSLDYFGTWKLFDALCDAAFSGTNREYALGNTAQQKFMGNWSDGVAVAPLVVVEKP